MTKAIRGKRLVSWGLAAALIAGGLACTAVAPAAAPATAAPSAAEKALIATEDGMLKAKIARDTDTIARGMTDEVTYTHATGMVQTKAQYLQSIRDGRTDYRSIEPVGRVARVSGDLGITHGIVRMMVGERRLQDSYLAAYVKRDGRWQLLFWQSSLEPGAMPMGGPRSGGGMNPPAARPPAGDAPPRP